MDNAPFVLTNNEYPLSRFHTESFMSKCNRFVKDAAEHNQNNHIGQVSNKGNGIGTNYTNRGHSRKISQSNKNDAANRRNNVGKTDSSFNDQRAEKQLERTSQQYEDTTATLSSFNESSHASQRLFHRKVDSVLFSDDENTEDLVINKLLNILEKITEEVSARRQSNNSNSVKTPIKTRNSTETSIEIKNTHSKTTQTDLTDFSVDDISIEDVTRDITDHSEKLLSSMVVSASEANNVGDVNMGETSDILNSNSQTRKKLSRGKNRGISNAGKLKDTICTADKSMEESRTDSGNMHNVKRRSERIRCRPRKARLNRYDSYMSAYYKCIKRISIDDTLEEDSPKRKTGST